jgi:hypothetical protein
MCNYHATPFSYHLFHTIINFAKTLPKPLKSKISIPCTIIFHEILHSYNNLVSSNDCVSKSHKIPIYVLTKLKLNKKNPKVDTSHNSPCDSTCALMCQNFPHKLSWVSQCTLMCKRLSTRIIMWKSCTLIEAMTKPWLYHEIQSPSKIPNLTHRHISNNVITSNYTTMAPKGVSLVRFVFWTCVAFPLGRGSLCAFLFAMNSFIYLPPWKIGHDICVITYNLLTYLCKWNMYSLRLSPRMWALLT